MSFFSNQNFQVNGDVTTKIAVIKRNEAVALANSRGFQDLSTLSTWVETDKNILKLESSWDKQGMSSIPLFQDAVKHDAVLKVNGWGGMGEFSYQMPVETDNCMKTVEDTSYQAVDGGVGFDGAPFKIIINRELAPNTPLSCDGTDGEVLVVSDIYPVQAVQYGFETWVYLLSSLTDSTKSYDPSLLESGREYFLLGSAFITEFSEKLLGVDMPSGTNYIENKFKLGSGQGVETYFTGHANSVKLMPGFVNADTTQYINEITSQGYDPVNDVVGVFSKVGGKTQMSSVGSLLEHLAIKQFTKNFNTSLMFMQGGAISTSKGNLVFNEGLWRQMLRGFIHTYSRRGNFTYDDLRILRDYVFQGNPLMKVEESVMAIKCGTELYDNLDVLTQAEAQRQINNLAPLLGADRITPQPIVTGSLDNLEVALVKYGSVNVPGIGKVKPMRDISMDYTKITDRQLKGVNIGGKDFTTYSGIIWDVTDQMYSNNRKLPAGTKAVNGNDSSNIYLVQPEGETIYWGRENGRYSQFKATDILASGKTMHESFFMYGFGAMWMADPSKFAMTQLEKGSRLGTK